MNRRHFLRGVMALSATGLVPACGRTANDATSADQVMTVHGLMPATSMGVTLTHEHVFADVRPWDEQQAEPLAIDMDEVAGVVLPHLAHIRDLGCRTVVDCTATGIGRHPALVRHLSDRSGLHMLVATGTYLAAGGIFVQPHVRRETAADLAARWVGEFRDGIGDTGVRPGLIKISLDDGPLGELETTVLRAAAMTHLETGLVIGAHTGAWEDVQPGRNATTADGQLDILQSAGVDPSAWIWIHAHNEPDRDRILDVARRGAWVSFDGFRPDQLDVYLDLIGRVRAEGLLGRLLLSQDAGWYTAGQPGGGDFSPFHPILSVLVPELRTRGYSEEEVETLLVTNPASAFALRARRLAA